jgi:hypothetical protein
MTLLDKEDEEDIEQFHAAVDIPKVDSAGQPSDEWYCVEYFKTKEEAIAYAREHYGADENGMVCLISTF